MLTVLVGLVVGFWAVGLASTAATSWLLAEHPLVLVALEPRNRNLLLTTPLIDDAVPFVVLATIRRVASDPVYFALGHLYGDRAVAWVERRAGGGVRLLERAFRRASWPLVFAFPGLLVCVLAGATGMRTRTFLALNITGTVLTVLALRLFAQQLEPVLDPIAEWNERNQTTITVVLVVAVAAWLLWQRRRGRGEVAAVKDLVREVDG
jgi:membrane protein DedA with SNARE-associated domain